MLKRAWFVLAGLWAAVFLGNGSTRLHGIQNWDWLLAFAPLAIGWLVAEAARFIVTGTVTRPPRALPYRKP
jgi:hypothetical protein